MSVKRIYKKKLYVMKNITINYLSHNRLNYTELMFYFLTRIKDSNKEKIKLNILATHDNNWVEKCEKLGIEYEIYTITSNNNYLDKINIAISTNTKYSVKLDEDCFINNHVWDFLIENVDLLENQDILTMSPVMSNNIPSCDYFISDYITDENIKDKIYGYFLNRDMPNGLWGVNYTPLNEITTQSKVWK